MSDATQDGNTHDPLTHTEYLRSGGATTLMFMVDGARAVNSLVIILPMAAKLVDPQYSTTLPYKSLRMLALPFFDGLDGGVMNALSLFANETWLEEHL